MNLLGWLIGYMVFAGDDCLTQAKDPIQCIDCNSEKDGQFCNDPFNTSYTSTRSITCDQPCVKWVKLPGTGEKEVVRTCASNLNIQFPLADVCMSESRPGDGHLCMCMDSHCNSATSILGGPGSGPASYPLIMLSLIVVIMVQNFILRRRETLPECSLQGSGNSERLLHSKSNEREPRRCFNVFCRPGVLQGNSMEEISLSSNVRSKIYQEKETMTHPRITCGLSNLHESLHRKSNFKIRDSMLIIITPKLSHLEGPYYHFIDYLTLPLSIISISSFVTNCCKYYCVFICDKSSTDLPNAEQRDDISIALQTLCNFKSLPSDWTIYQHILEFEWCSFAQFEKAVLLESPVMLKMVAYIDGRHISLQPIIFNTQYKLRRRLKRLEKPTDLKNE